MKQLDLIPKVFHDTSVDYLYPFGISLLFVALCALIIGSLLWKEHKVNLSRFDDVIKALKTGNHEVVERIGRVHCRQQIQIGEPHPAQDEEAQQHEDAHQA